MSFTLPNDENASIPIRFAHNGHPAPAPTDAAVTSSDESVATVALSDDKASILVTSGNAGTTNIAYASGALAASIDVTVTVPTADSAEFDPDAATLTLKA